MAVAFRLSDVIIIKIDINVMVRLVPRVFQSGLLLFGGEGVVNKAIERSCLKIEFRLDVPPCICIFSLFEIIVLETNFNFNAISLNSFIHEISSSNQTKA